MIPSITFGKLYDKLRDLDFTVQEIEWEGLPRYVFEHKTIANTMIILPKRERNDPVEPFYMNSVLTLLKSRHLVSEYNPLLT